MTQAISSFVKLLAAHTMCDPVSQAFFLAQPPANMDEWIAQHKILDCRGNCGGGAHRATTGILHINCRMWAGATASGCTTAGETLATGIIVWRTDRMIRLVSA